MPQVRREEAQRPQPEERWTRWLCPPRVSWLLYSANSRRDTTQKAINLPLSGTRDSESTFSEGGFHKTQSHGFLSQDANRVNRGGFIIFMFYPKTADMGGMTFGEKGSNQLLSRP